MFETKRVASYPRFLLSPVALLSAAMLASLAGTEVRAQAVDAAVPAPVLRSSPMLQEVIPADVRKQLPVFITGDQISGQPDLEAVITGNAEVRRGDTVIRANRLEYYQPKDQAKAQGNVRLNRAGNVYEGDTLDLRVEAFEGFFTQVRYEFLQTQAHGEADRVDFLDPDRSVIHNATYTTCMRDGTPGWMPAWILSATTIRLDEAADVGVAEGAVLRFMNVPILPVPSISFPLSEKRKSGLLPPTIGVDNVNGIEVTQPYYWNIAPNRDATLYPTVMSKRGVNTGAEFRYLENNYSGSVRADFMPNDRLRDRNRWGYSAQHQGTLFAPEIGAVGLGLNLNRVSDDNYWRDFTRSSRSLTQRLLPNDVNLSWGRGDLSISARTLKWQTLQDVASPIVPPYDRLPQILTRYSKLGIGGGFDASVETEYTRFQADRNLTGQPNAQRTYSLAQVSRPFLRPGWFVTPKVQLHATSYQFDSMLANGERSANRVVPTASLDSGLIFERDASFFGRGFRQTLEPRAFYVYTPFRDQRLLPNYDSASTDFNFATVYTENAFGGNDRISDNNLLTVGVTTRLLDPETGAEAARFGIAQRLRFKDQNVTLPGGNPVSERLSDVLLGAAVNWTPKWSVDSTIQYNPKTQESIRSTIGTRYSPGNYRTISAAYRLQKQTDAQRQPSEQIDVGWQWPINDLWGDKGKDLGAGRGQGGGRWYSVGRVNYSLEDRKLVDTIVGVEYDGCCYIGRVVFERLQSGLQTAHKRILFQIEFVGLSRLGASPIRTLRENIPQYQFLREQTTTPSRFSNYD